MIGKVFEEVFEEVSPTAIIKAIGKVVDDDFGEAGKIMGKSFVAKKAINKICGKDNDNNSDDNSSNIDC